MVDATYNLAGSHKPNLKRTADRDGPDFFPTPAWATHALTDNEIFRGGIWEPACGNGAMSKVLSNSTGNFVFSSDLYDRGFGETGIDFLNERRDVDNIITNPPYNSAEGFVSVGLPSVRNKLALLLRLAFLEGVNRNRMIFARHPPSRVWVFSERITFYPLGAKRAGSGTTAYAWFVWDKQSTGPTEIRWFRPGYKAKYHEPS